MVPGFPTESVREFKDSSPTSASPILVRLFVLTVLKYAVALLLLLARIGKSNVLSCGRLWGLLMKGDSVEARFWSSSSWYYCCIWCCPSVLATIASRMRLVVPLVVES